ncbi:MAG TPA: bifunctional glutamine synthetase adenylyltransferase/deadenyltransferase, partial [Woeseiaceae bacterium]|nr:bifunctional glutamine synthetase adenylyltransferase/deadenyltransferase [Woeseiaceae bacterium]
MKHLPETRQSSDKDFQDAIRALPGPLHEALTLWVERLLDRHPAGLADLADEPRSRSDLLKLAACSEFAGTIILRDWEWFAGAALAGRLNERPDMTLCLPAMDPAMDPAIDNDGANAVKQQLRQFRNRNLVHILWRELACAAPLEETLRSLTELADTLVAAASNYAGLELSRRFGIPRDESGQELRIVVLAMGKLGGRELNFSSDIDLIFLYPGNGETDGEQTLSAHEYFVRLSRRIVALLDDVTPDGFVYRVDTRLRP